jgi:hypothetical protein
VHRNRIAPDSHIEPGLGKIIYFFYLDWFHGFSILSEPARHSFWIFQVENFPEQGASLATGHNSPKTRPTRLCRLTFFENNMVGDDEKFRHARKRHLSSV